METLHRTVDIRELMETYRELLPAVDSLPLVVSGNSMAPYLVHGRDTVHLSAVRGNLHVGDMVLYQRDSGSYILHRICRKRGETFSLAGDAHTVVEKNIRRDQIFAVVRSVERKGRREAPGSFWWEFFSRVWVRVIPARLALLQIAGMFYRVLRRRTT